MEDKRFMTIEESLELNDTPQRSEVGVRGHVIFRDAETQEVLHEEDNLVLMRTRVWLFERLFNTTKPANIGGSTAVDRSICLFSIGSGGADVGATAFTPYTPKFNDQDLGQPVPFITIDPDKPNNSETQANPSVVTELSAAQTSTYYQPVSNPDGTKPYYAKRFKGATTANPLGVSRKWVVDQTTGEVAFSLALSIDKTEARGTLFNELGLWLGKYNSSNNTFANLELASRLTFPTESLASLNKSIDIEYIMYI